MAPGPEQDVLFKKIAQADEATEIYNWINSPELNRRNDSGPLLRAIADTFTHDR